MWGGGVGGNCVIVGPGMAMGERGDKPAEKEKTRKNKTRPRTHNTIIIRIILYHCRPPRWPFSRNKVVRCAFFRWHFTRACDLMAQGGRGRVCGRKRRVKKNKERGERDQPVSGGRCSRGGGLIRCCFGCLIGSSPQGRRRI